MSDAQECRAGLAVRRGMLAFIFGVSLCSCLVSRADVGAAQAMFTLHGRIVDRQGKAVTGAEVAFYTTPDVRRPVDFLSPPSIENGSYAVALPAGTYWCIARQRSGGRFGPLRPTDRHSGAPVEVVGKPSETITADFTIASLREMGEEKRAPDPDTVQLRVRLVDKAGAPVANAYAFARRDAGAAGIPDFLSPAADPAGSSSLILPPGTYFVGADVDFPPKEGKPLKKLSLGGENGELLIDLEVTR